MSKPPSVAYFKPPKTVNSEVGKVEVTFGTLPDSIENVSITMRGPYEIEIPAAYCPTGDAPLPVYDYQKDHVVWAGKIASWKRSHWDEQRKESDEWSGNIGLFRIGKYFNLQAVDRPEFVGATWADVSSVMTDFETGLASVAYNLQSKRLGVGQKREKGGEESWFQIPMSIAEPQSSDSHNGGALFNHQSPSNKTVYHVSAPETWDDPGKAYLYLDTIPSSAFSTLHKDRTLFWRRHKLKVKHPDSGSEALRKSRLVPMLTHDKNNIKFRLSIFQVQEAKLVMETVELRKDGSVPSYTDEIVSQGFDTLDIREKGQNLCVLQYADKVMVTWTNENGIEQERIGTIDDDGKIKESLKDFKDVKFKFEKECGHIFGCGVVVPDSFHGWTG